MENSYFENRKSVRNFADKPVSDRLVEEIVNKAMKAPNTGNMQLYSVVVTRSAEGRKAMAPFHFSQKAAVEAPVLLTVCADIHRFTRWCEVSGADKAFGNFLSFVSAFADAVIFAQQIVTIAEMEGLGTCYLGTVTYNAPEIAELLGLPKGVVPVACIALGWPQAEGEPTERLPLAGILHEEKYRELTDDEVREIFRAKEDFAPNRKYVEENKKENLAQVFSEVRYPRSMNEEFSEKFVNYLIESGLLWNR